jgi:hypothetical protein
MFFLSDLVETTPNPAAALVAAGAGAGAAVAGTIVGGLALIGLANTSGVAGAAGFGTALPTIAVTAATLPTAPLGYELW